MPCSGNAQQLCGGPDTLSLFVNPNLASNLNADLNAIVGGATSAAGGAATTASSAVSSAASAAATVTAPSGWNTFGLVAEGTSGRALTGPSTSGGDMTLEKCAAFAAQNNMPLFGLEYGGECYTGQMLSNGAALSKVGTNSPMPCNGNQAQTCGGPSMLSLFATQDAVNNLNSDMNALKNPAQPSASAAPTTSPADLPSGWAVASTACVAEGTSGRALAADRITGADMTGNKCMQYCASKGYAYSCLLFVVAACWSLGTRTNLQVRG